MINLLPLFIALLLLNTIQAEDSIHQKNHHEFIELVQQAHSLHREKRYRVAAILWNKASTLSPTTNLVYYNMACSLALSDQKTKALEALKQAVAHGWDDLEHIKNDSDLSSLHTDPIFAKLLEQIANSIPKHSKGELLLPFNKASKNKRPLLIFLHGTGGNAQDGKAHLQPFADKEQFIVYLPNGSVAMGKRQSDGKSAQNWRSAKDSKHIIQRVKSLIADGIVDPKHIYIAGFSAGGVMSYAIGIKEPQLFTGIIVYSGTLQDGMLSQEEITLAAPQIPIAVWHGSGDRVIPIKNGKHVYQQLKEEKYHIKWEEFPGGHHYPPEFQHTLTQSINWLKTFAPAVK